MLKIKKSLTNTFVRANNKNKIYYLGKKIQVNNKCRKKLMHKFFYVSRVITDLIILHTH